MKPKQAGSENSKKRGAAAESVWVVTRKVAWGATAAADAGAVVVAMAAVETVAVAVAVITEIINLRNTIVFKILSVTKGFFFAD